MVIQFTCPHCKSTIQATEDLVGQQARCGSCKQIIVVERTADMEVNGTVAPTTTAAPENKEPPGPATVNGKLVDVPRTALQREKPPPAKTVVEDGGPTGLVLATSASDRENRNRALMMLQSFIRKGNPTDVSIVLTGVVAVVLTWLSYLVIVTPIRSTEVGQLLAERGWVQYATMYFTIWAAVVLAIKFWKITTQQKSLTYDILPVDRTKKITPNTVDLIENHIKQLPLNPKKNFLINRILMALENFKARKSVPEVSTVLSTQADTDAAVVDSSYAMLKVLIWGIPILGFIGTVIGISDAVQHFTGAVQRANELEVVKTALGNVTKGLAVALDTTLLSLILSMVIMFPNNWVQKTEEDLLRTIDQYCTENLLPRLATDALPPAAESLEQQHTMQMMNAYLSAMQDWQKRLETLETVLLEKVMDTLGDVRQELAKKNQLQEDRSV